MANKKVRTISIKPLKREDEFREPTEIDIYDNGAMMLVDTQDYEKMVYLYPSEVRALHRILQKHLSHNRTD